jgi:flavin-dependent dehydrogenase
MRMHPNAHFNVVICGAGLAGLSLARQLKLELPQLSVALIDRLSSPFPEAAHKVGESSNELGSYYLAKTLRLEDYLAKRHLRKFSLRFFFGDARGPFEDRPELGVKIPPPLATYQIDRGRLENDLRRIVASMGIDLIEGTIVEDIVLSDNAHPHRVVCRNERSGERCTLAGGWVVDAAGRPRLLQSKLGLMAPNGHPASSAWWRIAGRIDVGVLGKSRQWRKRVVEDRYWSTNHLMGRGYWVWLIPLSSGATSIGIVTDETIHPLSSYGKSFEHSLEWLRRYEPALWELIKDCEILDFHRLKHFSYHARQVFSRQRWSCVGEAGVFLDPLYSVGSDFIAFGNTITTEMIRRDLDGNLSDAAVERFNRLYLEFLAQHALAYYQRAYRTFGHAHICTAKLAWDTAIFWAIVCQLYIQGVFRCPSDQVFALLERYNRLHERVENLLIDWAEATPPRATFVHADLSRMKLHQLLYLDLFTRRNLEQVLTVARLNLDRLEELAQILFWQAVRECLPEHMPAGERNLPWINAWGISLSPERWQEDNLFLSVTAPRDLTAMRDTFAGVFGPMTWREMFRVELPYRIRHMARGKPVAAVVRFGLRHFICDRPAIWLRRLLVSDYPSSAGDAVKLPADASA